MLALLVIERGVVWDKSSNPTINLSTKTSDGQGVGSYTSSITNLSPGTKYFVRAYATNSRGTAYGNEINFTTSETTIPSITTTAISSVGAISAKSGGEITSDGGLTIIAKGVVWSTSSNPTAALTTKTSEGIGSSNFISRIVGLQPNTKYFVRAYATNDKGTGYGIEISFTTGNTTTGPVTDIDGNVYQTTAIGNQSWITSNLKTTKYTDGTPITTGLSEDQWASTTSGAYSVYNNNPTNNDVYGKLYNWYAVTDSRNLCPTGFHPPSIDEWNILADNLGGYSIAGGKMKEIGLTHWNSPNAGATNSSGFTALPHGTRTPNTNIGAVSFNGLGALGGYWLTFNYNSQDGAFSIIFSSTANLGTVGSNKKVTGWAVRCLRD